VAGVPLLLRALRPFTAHPAVMQVVVALPAGIAADPPDWLARLRGERLTFVAGGPTRAASVRAGLGALRPAARVALVHDAARPFVRRETIDAVIARARAGVGALAAVPMGDTIKEVAADHRVARTVPREGLWRAQTPQGFPRAMLEAAYGRLESESPPPTDDAELCERAGFPVEVVADSAENVKVTTSEDFRIAEALAREWS
jgi:2-C-methyl-D-erythritol 4-phosphate cytidylyltransferase